GTDLRERVPTLPVLYVRAAAGDGDEAAAEVVRLLDADLTSDEALEAARAALAAHPVTERARAEALRWAEDAKAALEPVPAGRVKDALLPSPIRSSPAARDHLTGPEPGAAPVRSRRLGRCGRPRPAVGGGA